MKTQDLLGLIVGARVLLRELRIYGMERDRVLALIDKAEAEGREPTVEELRAELGDYADALDELEARITLEPRRPDPE